MKYKSKQTGEVISKELFDQIDHFTCQSSEDYFEPVYEVGDWIKTKAGTIAKIVEVRDTHIFLLEDRDGFPLGVYGAYKIDHLITHEEIESMTKKFPFSYLSEGKIEHLVYSDDKHDQVNIVAGNIVLYLTKLGWQQIGIRKGWTL